MDTTLFGTIAPALAIAVFSSALVVAAVTDVTRYTIPNSLIIWLMAGYAALAPLSGLGMREIVISLGVASMVFFATVAGFALGWMGAGDSKLLTVAALWLGPQVAVQFLILTMVLGGIVALMLVTLRAVPAGYLRGSGGWLVRLHGADAGVPYGLPIGLAGLMTLPHTGWMAGF